MDTEERIEHVIAGLENCIGNAKLRNDDYDAGYIGAIKKEVEKIRDDLRAVLAKAGQQEPIGKIIKSSECGGIDFYFDKIPDGETMLYSHSQPAQAVPEGWKFVPVEPTPEMLKEIHLIDEFSERALIVRYKAMLSASPKPE